MAKFPKSTIKAATERYLVDRSDYHRDRLVELLLPWIQKIAWSVKTSMVTSLDVDDLVQSGCIALVNGLPRFDGRCLVTTFAALRVKGAMLDACRQYSVVPRLEQEKLSRILQATKRLTQELSREPTEAEIIEGSGLTRAEYLVARRFAAAAQHASVMATFRNDDGELDQIPAAADQSAPDPTPPTRRHAPIASGGAFRARPRKLKVQWCCTTALRPELAMNLNRRQAMIAGIAAVAAPALSKVAPSLPPIAETTTPIIHTCIGLDQMRDGTLYAVSFEYVLRPGRGFIELPGRKAYVIPASHLQPSPDTAAMLAKIQASVGALKNPPRILNVKM